MTCEGSLTAQLDLACGIARPGGARPELFCARLETPTASCPAAVQGWGENDRGVSYTFGPDSVTEFLQKHDLDLICRAHQACQAVWHACLMRAAVEQCSFRNPVAALKHPPAPSRATAAQVVEEGYEFFARRQLVTIFSAPNYCGEFDNAGAMMSVDDTLMCSFQVGWERCLFVWCMRGQPATALIAQQACSWSLGPPWHHHVALIPIADSQACRKEAEVSKQTRIPWNGRGRADMT